MTSEAQSDWLVVVRLSENESRPVGTKFEELVKLSNPNISGLGIIPHAKQCGTILQVVVTLAKNKRSSKRKWNYPIPIDWDWKLSPKQSTLKGIYDVAGLMTLADSEPT